jgi:metal-responsive CopG/Arc/MetJ family transcriptional regulator
MPRTKMAIAVPSDLLAEVDEAACAAGESRSTYITRVLRAVVRARRDTDVTRRLNRLFADEEVSNHRAAGADLGVDWTEERW